MFSTMGMNTYASSSMSATTTARVPHHHARSSSSPNVVWDIVGSVMYPIGQEQLQYDSRGRLMPFVETNAQRKERERLLRRREHSRRVNKWLEESTIEVSKIHIRTSSTSTSGRRYHLSGDRSECGTEDGEEPYILYSTSSSPSYMTSRLSASPVPSTLGQETSSPSLHGNSLLEDETDRPRTPKSSSSRRSSRSSFGSMLGEARPGEDHAFESV